MKDGKEATTVMADSPTTDEANTDKQLLEPNKKDEHEMFYVVEKETLRDDKLRAKASEEGITSSAGPRPTAENLEFANQIMPMPSPNSRDARRMDPGAHHSRPILDAVQDPADTPSVSQAFLLVPHPDGTDNDNDIHNNDNNGLAVAQAVADYENPIELHQAKEDALNGDGFSAAWREKKDKESKTIIILGLIFLSAIVAFVVGSAVFGNRHPSN